MQRALPVYDNVRYTAIVLPSLLLAIRDLDFRSAPYHAYQSLACETAINTDFSELFSLKRIYVKYINAILSLIDCFVHT